MPMKITVRAISGEIICTVNNADNKTPKDVITDIEQIYEHMKLLSMTLITSFGKVIHDEHYNTRFSDQEQKSVIELTLVSNDKRICYIEDMKRILENIIWNLDLNKCRDHEKTMYKIVSNVSSDEIVFSEFNIFKQFTMMNRKPSVWSKFEHCGDNAQLRSIVNLIKNFTMTKEIATLMISKLLDVAVFNIVREVIIKLCSHECIIIGSEPDMVHNDTVKHPRDEIRYNNYDENVTVDHPDESHTVKQPHHKEIFRNFVVNEVQKRFEFLLGNISQAPLKMLSLIIVISRLFSGKFISRVVLAKICDDLFNRRNDTNRTFIISYINIILEICTPTLL